MVGLDQTAVIGSQQTGVLRVFLFHFRPSMPTSARDPFRRASDRENDAPRPARSGVVAEKEGVICQVPQNPAAWEGLVRGAGGASETRARMRLQFVGGGLEESIINVSNGYLAHLTTAVSRSCASDMLRPVARAGPRGPHTISRKTGSCRTWEF